MEVQDTGHWEGAKQGGKMWKCKTLDTGRGPSKGVRCGSARHWRPSKGWKCKTLDTGRGPSKGVRCGSARHWTLGGGQARG